MVWLVGLMQGVAARALEEKIYKPEVRTVLCYPEGVLNAYPVYELGSRQRLVLEFDNLTGQYREYHCQIVHCDRFWNPSPLYPLQYREGLESEVIDDVTYSSATFVQYSHYRYRFPSEQMRPTRAGNYALIVFENGDVTDTVLVRRFYVVDKRVEVSGKVRAPALPRYAFSHQDVRLSVDYSALGRPAQPSDFGVVVRQNKAWMTERQLVPTSAGGNRLEFDYAYEDAFYFPGLHEWRAFDARSVRTARFHVRKVEYDGEYHLRLYPDEPRRSLPYSFTEDNNGDYFVLTEGGSLQVSPDYVWVHFRLQRWRPDGGVPYVFGGLTDWRLLPEARMQYQAGEWRGRLQVKQGYYDYMYVVQRADGTVDLTAIEGTHFETENNYLVLVYYREPQLGVDELVGWLVLSSGE